MLVRLRWSNYRAEDGGGEMTENMMKIMILTNVKIVS